MFRKLVSNVAFSPALVGQLGFYAKRLRKEEATRRIGLIFTVLALIIQSFAVFSPPESANASNPSNFVDGGVTSIKDYLSHYDVNSRHIKDIMTSVGITRAEIKAAKKGTFNSKQVLSWGLTSRFSSAQGERTFTYQKADGGSGTVYYRPLTLWDSYAYTKKYGSTYDGYIGHSAKFGWFAIMKNCGNLITKKPPVALPKPAVACVALDVAKIDAHNFRFTARASAKNGATIKGYAFKVYQNGNQIRDKSVASTDTKGSVAYNRDTPGNYTVTATVQSSLGNQTSDSCQKPFSVAKTTPPPAPLATCDALTASKITRTSYRFTTEASAANGAKIDSYTYVVKNSSGKTVLTKTAGATYTYSQPTADDYSVAVTANTSVGKKNSANCNDTFTVSPPPATPYAACSELDTRLVGRTMVALTGAASASGGATVSKYTFVVKDKSGKTVATTNVSTSELTASPDNITINTPGTYTATLAVATSAGTKTSPDCSANFTIAKPAVCSVNPSLPATSPDCQPCPGNSTIWIKDESCAAKVIDTKTAVNINQNNVDATTTTAKAADRIAYTIRVQNTGLTAADAPLQEKLDDVLEYATLVDTGGGTLDKSTGVLSWPSVTLQPGETQSRTFVVKVSSTIPSMGKGTSDGTSYDCIMTNTFGNTVNINVDCPAPKQVEQVVSELPHTGPTENILFAGVVFALVAFLYARSRQMKKEVRLIRRDLNAGAL